MKKINKNLTNQNGKWTKTQERKRKKGKSLRVK